MQVQYDEDFLEASVFLAASGQRPGVPALQLARFHREREKLYDILGPDERSAAFFRLHLEWFREWGLERPLRTVLGEFPLLREQLTVLAVHQAPTEREEGAELYVNPEGQRTGVLALRRDRLRNDNVCTRFLRHEFSHLHDLLNPAFGYAPALELPGLNQAQQRLAGERYRLLWDITIDGRLARKGHTPSEPPQHYAAAFRRAYSFWPEARQTTEFARLWEAQAPTHQDLLALAANPRGLREVLAPGPVPGAVCPLCGFTTHAWADTYPVRAHVLDRIVAEFPTWTPADGLCGRCLEAYEAQAARSQEATRNTRELQTTSPP
jgi:hypothetical protein